MSIALIGSGAIASFVRRELDAAGHSIAAVLVRPGKEHPGNTPAVSSVSDLPKGVDLLIGESRQYHRLLISGPFGSGRSTLEGREGRFSLTTAEGRFEAETPEALMAQRLGWSLPVSALSDWIRGLPAEGSTHRVERDDLGFPRRLEQDGWDIAYRDWTRVEGLWLPRKMVMTYDTLRATLVVTEWRPALDE